MRAEDLRKLFRPEVFPFGGVEIRTEQCGCVVEMVERTNLFVAKNTFFVGVPVRDDLPDQAILRINFDLL